MGRGALLQMEGNQSCIDHGRKGNRQGYSTTSYESAIIPLHRAVYLRCRDLSRATVLGRVVRHTCDNPRCINPFHLIIGTQYDNVHDAMERGRHISGSRVGTSKLTEDVVAAIRAEYIPYSKQYGSAAIARRLGVNQSSVSEAVRGVTYKEVL